MRLFNFNNERMQELLLVVDDNMSTLNHRFRIALVACLIAVIPLFFILKFSFYFLSIKDYQGPTVTKPGGEVAALSVVDKKIFALDDQTYSGYVKIKNINLDRGVAELAYTAEFKTFGGTTLASVSGKTFILPASEKILVFSRFNSDKKPDVIEFSLAPQPHFIYKPQLPNINVEIQRTQFEGGSEFAVNAAVRNASAFTLKQIYLPILLYDKDHNIVGVNSTIVNQVKSSEVRGFRFVWPKKIAGAIRAEINPEVNIFDKGLLTTQLEEVELR